MTRLVVLVSSHCRGLASHRASTVAPRGGGGGGGGPPSFGNDRRRTHLYPRRRQALYEFHGAGAVLLVHGNGGSIATLSARSLTFASATVIARQPRSESADSPDS